MGRELSAADKARAVLTRTGQAGNRVTAYNEAEIDELAAIYDECVAPETQLKQRISDFHGRRAERLAELKATEEADAAADRFRNRTEPSVEGDETQPAAGDSPAAETAPTAEAAPAPAAPAPPVSGS